MADVAGVLARGGRAVLWYLRGLTGESRYEAYVAHERDAHPDRAPMSRDAFWRAESRRIEAEPQGRCC